MCLVAFGFLYMISALAPAGGGSSRYLPQAWRDCAQTARELWRSIRCRVPKISLPPLANSVALRGACLAPESSKLREWLGL